MGLREDILVDIGNIIDATDDFATTAIFNSISTISVIFNDEAKIVDVNGDILTTSPQATVKSSDVVNPQGKTLKIDSVTYNIVDVRPENSDLTILYLSRDTDG